MLRKIIMFVLLFNFISSLCAQEYEWHSPDYDLIKKETFNEKSEFLYSNLLSRFYAFDSTLTKKDYEYLYYGYLYQKEYKPYKKAKNETALLSILKKNSQIQEEDYEEIIKLTTESIQEYPFALDAMAILSYIYKLKGDTENYLKIRFRLYDILEVITNSGDGSTCRNAFHVTSTDHEYVLLKMINKKPISQELIFLKDPVAYCDLQKLHENSKGYDSVYFDVTKLFEAQAERIKKGE
ncbi:DUF4919 domain-containing protein [Apibacter muscae]|uniref:DUF4919 domain-containing protein n=1 Tax=Apibacter muscae TaxID=2509004 RepID=UPI0011AC3F80|nr:DUF4919 domain-containing protein [Apibacter muscae]TWP24327.1 DUF4919 domain-containing protein [Apibacter muscae]TWP30111.1 DUF4919 domain-containing protein [Apibacter muscae]